MRRALHGLPQHGHAGVDRPCPAGRTCQVSSPRSALPPLRALLRLPTRWCQVPARGSPTWRPAGPPSEPTCIPTHRSPHLYARIQRQPAAESGWCTCRLLDHMVCAPPFGCQPGRDLARPRWHLVEPRMPRREVVTGEHAENRTPPDLEMSSLTSALNAACFDAKTPEEGRCHPHRQRPKQTRALNTRRPSLPNADGPAAG